MSASPAIHAFSSDSPGAESNGDSDSFPGVADPHSDRFKRAQNDKKWKKEESMLKCSKSYKQYTSLMLRNGDNGKRNERGGHNVFANENKVETLGRDCLCSETLTPRNDSHSMSLH